MVLDADKKMFNNLLLTESGQIDPEIESMKNFYYNTEDENTKYAAQFLTIIKEAGKDNPVYEALYLSVKHLLAIKRLKFMVSDENFGDSSSTMLGRFNSSLNIIDIILYKNYFKKKWLLFTNYDQLDDEYLLNTSNTILHELMHYIAYNNTIPYLKIWNNIHKKLLQLAIAKLILVHRNDFAENLFKVFPYTDVNSLYKDAKFNNTFDLYYGIIRRTDIITKVTHVAVYENVVNELYLKCDWYISRFFDLILNHVTEISNTTFEDKRTKDIYLALRNSYIEIFPNIDKSDQFKSWFFQELLFPSEISCICAQCCFDIPDLRKLVIETLKLV